jgi:hypothetical protein
MSYETGTSTGATDLLGKIRAFAIAQGWTVNRWVAATGGWELCINLGDNYVNMRSYENATMLVNGSSQASKYGIVINSSDGYSGGAQWDRQPGYPQRNITPSDIDQAHAMLPLVTNIGPFPSYHLFGNATDIMLELEVNTSVFQRMGFGKLSLFNPAAPRGGRFYYATGGTHVTSSALYYEWLGVHIDHANYGLEEAPFRLSAYGSAWYLSGSAVRFSDAPLGADGWARSGVFNSDTGLLYSVVGRSQEDIMSLCGPSPLNGLSVLTPVIVRLNRDSVYHSPMGAMKDFRYLDITNYLPGDEFTLGPDTWKVFPIYQKGGRSLNQGLAYRKT